AVNREIPAPRVFFQRAVDIVTQDAPGLVDSRVSFLIGRTAPKRRDFHDLTTEAYVRQAKPSSDQAAVTEKRLDLFRRRRRGNVKILRLHANEQIAHAAADQVAFIACVLEP